jgi:hypothetical protein
MTPQIAVAVVVEDGGTTGNEASAVARWRHRSPAP